MPRLLLQVLPVALLVALAAPRLAAAQEPAPPASDDSEKKARALYERGNTHYDLAEYDQAIALFKEAYTLSRRPTLLYNIAQAYRLKGDCELALQFYKNYLRLAPDAKNKDKVAERVSEMETCVNDPSRKKPVAKEALETSGQGGPDTGRPGGGGPGGGAIEPPPPPAPGAGDGPRRGGTKKLVGLVTVGVGVALVGTGVYFGLDASDKSDQLAAACRPEAPCTWTPALDALKADGEAAESRATIFYVAGGAAVVGGAVLYFLGASDARQRGTSVSLVPHPRGGAFASAAFRF